MSVSRHWPEVETQVARVMMTCLQQYWQAMGIGPYWPEKPLAEEIRLKRYLPDGRDAFPPHVDVMDDGDSRRFVTAILYLNQPGGGETVFPGLDVSVPPAPGRLVVFPPLWLFPHAGLPPRDRAEIYPPQLSVVSAQHPRQARLSTLNRPCWQRRGRPCHGGRLDGETSMKSGIILRV